MLTDIVLDPPVNSMIEIAGPEPLPLDAIARQVLSANGDTRPVTSDADAHYFGTKIDDTSLRPGGDNPRLAPTRFEDWLAHSVQR